MKHKKSKLIKTTNMHRKSGSVIELIIDKLNPINLFKGKEQTSSTFKTKRLYEIIVFY